MERIVRAHSPVFSDDVIKTEVKLVKCESLLGLLRRFAGRIGVSFLVVHFKACEHGVLKADIDTDDVVHQGVGFMGFQGRGYRQAGLCVSVEDVHEFLLLNSTWKEALVTTA